MSHVLIPDVVDVQGKPVFFVQSGSRDSLDVVLVLHGFMSDYRSMQMVAEKLSVPAGTTILLPDLPGFGSSEPFQTNGASLNHYIDWVELFLTAAAPSAQRVTIIGYSFGSYIAINYAARQPALLSNLILITPVIRVARPVRMFTTIFDNLSDYSMAAAHALYKWRPNFDLTSLYLTRSLHPEKVIKLLRHRRQELHDLRPEVVLELSRELLQIDLLESAPHITIPVFIMAAKYDTVAVKSATEKFVAALGERGTLHYLPKAGHLVPFEGPDQINQILDEKYWPQNVALSPPESVS